ncbi:hypothetical protein WJX74_010932 [Apatococcus lobatus]|uniref:Condensation domain-containing protein n=1 Tax=Apatococcus lobatus TaxID=904363 RepID=A0AAW1RMC8_9CHLO
MTAAGAPLALRKYATSKLQDFKVPAKIHVVKSIPRSSAQKVQRWKLAELFSQKQDSKQPLIKAKSHRDVLEDVQAAWKEELGIYPAHGTSNFFESGGITFRACLEIAKIGAGLKLMGPLDRDALQPGYLNLLERHEALRTLVKPQAAGQMPLLYVQQPSELLQHFKVTAAATEEEATAIARAAWRADYNLENGPLVRMQVIKLDAEHHWLLLAVHHGIADQMSALIMLRDLAAFYSGSEEAGSFDDHGAFWRKHFAASDSGLHGRRVEEPMQTPNPISLPVEVPSNVVQSIQSIARKRQTSAMTVVLAAYAAASAEALSRHDIMVNMVTLGRDHPALQNVVSCFAALLPVSLPEAGVHKTVALLEHAASQLRASRQHNIPLGLLRDAAGALGAALPFLSLNADVDMTRSCPDFHGLESARLDLSSIAPPHASAMLVRGARISLFLRADAKAGLTGSLAYDPKHLNTASAQLLSQRFQALMASNWS